MLIISKSYQNHINMGRLQEIDEKAEAWLAKPDLELTDLDNNKSIKTNFMYTQRNFLNIRKWASGLLAYIRYLRKLIDIDAIIEEVFEKLRTQKLQFPIAKAQNPGTILNYTNPHTDYVYQINRIDDYRVEITQLTDPNFSTEQLMVTVKDSENVIIYPVVQTREGKITLYFPDKIHTNYTVYVI